MNLANLSDKQRADIERDKAAAAEIYRVRHGIKTRTAVKADMNKITDLVEFTAFQASLNKHQRVKVKY